jgi:hypothetical protein
MRKTQERPWDTLKQAAKALDLTLPQIKWLKANGAPGFHDSRVHPAELRPWLKDHASEIPEPSELVGADEENKRLRNEKLRIEIGKLKGDFISKTELAEELKKLTTATDGILKRRLIVEWPAKGAGMSAPELEKWGIEIHGRIVDDFEDFKKKWTV